MTSHQYDYIVNHVNSSHQHNAMTEAAQYWNSTWLVYINRKNMQKNSENETITLQCTDQATTINGSIFNFLLDMNNSLVNWLQSNTQHKSYKPTIPKTLLLGTGLIWSNFTKMVQLNIKSKEGWKLNWENHKSVILCLEDWSCLASECNMPPDSGRLCWWFEVTRYCTRASEEIGVPVRCDGDGCSDG